jgi:hypothetical protein
MPGNERRGDCDEGQERNRNRYEDPNHGLHRAAERSFTESMSLRRVQEWSNEIAVDPFLEYVRAEGQCDDDECKDCPIGERQADDRAFR